MKKDLELPREEMTFYERCPALAKSYNELIKRIRHTGTIIVTTANGNWYHSADPGLVKAKIKKIKSILDDTYVSPYANEESRQFEHFLNEGDSL